MKISIIKSKILTPLLIFITWLTVWEILSRSVGQVLLLPSPFLVAQEIKQLLLSASFYSILLTSLWNIFIGFLLSFLVGCLLAVVGYFYKTFYLFISPIIQIMKAIPVASFIILALLWIPGRGLSIFIAFMMVMPLIFTSVYQGLQATDKQLLQMTKLYQFGTIKTIRFLYLPSLVPFFLSAYQVGIGFAFKSAIAAEIIGTVKNSIGYQIYQAKLYLETPTVFAWTVIIVLFSVLIEKLGLKLSQLLTQKLNKGGN